jgi:hypothetical protein
MSLPSDGEGPGADEIADDAHEHGFAVYEDLEFVSLQVIGLAIAGLYHLWERLTKEFLLRQFMWQVSDEHRLKKVVAQANFAQIIESLEEMGWSVRSAAFYGDLDRARLIAAVVKHGDGKSCDELIAVAPELFHDFGDKLLNEGRGAKELELTRNHVEVSAAAVVAFFSGFPQCLRQSELPRLIR